MEQQDRDKITENCNELLPLIKWSEILPKLIDHGIYNKDHATVRQWQSNPENEGYTRNLYLNITHGGPNAFPSFVRCLSEVDQNDLVKILLSERSINRENVCSKMLQSKKSSNETKAKGETVVRVNKREFKGNTNILQSKKSGDEVKVEEKIAKTDNKRESELNIEIQQSEKSGDEVKVEKKTIKAEKGELQVNTERVIDVPSDNSNDNYYMNLLTTMETLTVRVKKSTKIWNSVRDKETHYKMSSNPRGIVLIINNIKFSHENSERLGAKHDHNNLRDLFEQMGFKVITPIPINLTCQKMKEKMSEFTCLDDLQNVASLFVIIMSHGINDTVYGVDGKSLEIQHILKLFSSSKCPKMSGKPKVFIFQMCRGENEQLSIFDQMHTDVNRNASDLIFPKSSKDQQPNGRSQKRDFSDILVVHATLPNHTAKRDIYIGSWYIQILCEVFMNNAHDTELLRLFQMTDERLSIMSDKNNTCQTSNISLYGFNKLCYLNPGFFQD